MIGAATAIQAFAGEKSRADYSADLLLRSAVERHFEILGEALRRLETLDPSLCFQISEHRRTIAFRNIIAHGYDAVDDDIV